MWRKLLTGGLTALLTARAALAAAPARINRVHVRDARFRLIRTLSGEQELSQFASQWQRKVKSARTSAQVQPREFRYILDIGFAKGSDGSDRWLYNPDGSSFILSPLAQPVFQLPQPESFNRLIGLDTAVPDSSSSR